MSLLLTPFLAAPAQEASPSAVAVRRLTDGNARFIADRPSSKPPGSERRKELVKTQKPFAVILACADSRVAPEIIFDQGLGDLFVVRVAGNVTDPDVLGSIEYAVEHLKATLVVVLGHENCGAVSAALDPGKLEGNLKKLIARVHVGSDWPKDAAAATSAAIRANALFHSKQLVTKSPVLKEFVQSKRLRIVAGIYSLQSGEVKWLDKSNAKKDVEKKK
jgi:carbonic anhydrase